MKKLELIPAILAKTPAEARARFDACKGLVSWVQVDVMNGTFVKNKTWHSATQANQWDITPSIELHLMVKNPLRLMERWQYVKRFKRALWHVEADVDHHSLLDWCRKKGIQGGLAISPQTSLATITPYLYHPAFSRALILGVRPGWSGQKLLPATYKKVAKLRALLPELPIAFDGGVNKRNLAVLAQSGVTAFSVASSIFNAPDPRKAIKEFKALLRELRET